MSGLVRCELGLSYGSFHVPKPDRSGFRRVGVGLMLVDYCAGFFQRGL
jgi:hypothetical protein